MVTEQAQVLLLGILLVRKVVLQGILNNMVWLLCGLVP
jgi:hypothetical protein